MITVTAACHGCPWTAGPGQWATVDRAAEKHTKAGHPTATLAEHADVARNERTP
jgi:hypothetical protein